jgi:hypothetical protein
VEERIMCAARGENYTHRQTHNTQRLRDGAYPERRKEKRRTRLCFAERKMMMLGNQESDSLLSNLEKSCVLLKKVMQVLEYGFFVNTHKLISEIELINNTVQHCKQNVFLKIRHKIVLKISDVFVFETLLQLSGQARVLF